MEFAAFSFMLIESEHDFEECSDDFNLLAKVFEECDRALDYIRILECPFMKPEYLLGMPGLIGDTRLAIGIDDSFKMVINLHGEKYFYSMQKGLGLDIAATEDINPILYQILFSERKDEVYLRYRNLIADACNALKISDESRSFVYLLSKVDGMGLCETYCFQDNKKRILSLIAQNQYEFDLLSNQLYFYTKMIRTEVVHKGRNISELVSLDKARDMNQQLFNIILKFCCAAITLEITSLDELKTYLDNAVNNFIYNKPKEETLNELPAVIYRKTTYVAYVEGLNVDVPQKRGNFLLLPKTSEWSPGVYYNNYVAKDCGKEYDKIFCEFTLEDFEYIIEILYRLNPCKSLEKDSAIIIGYNMPKIMSDYSSSVKLRERVVDYICGRMNEVLYYDMLSGAKALNGDILPPKIGLCSGIRIIYEFVEDTEMYLQSIPGSVYDNYMIPDTEYICHRAHKDDIYKAFFSNQNYIQEVYKNALINLCEANYFYDLTLKTSYLFDIFDSLDPRTYNDQVIKKVFAFTALDNADYLAQKHSFEAKRTKYRNPVLHAGKNILDIEPDIRKILQLNEYLQDLIIEFCVKIISLGIETWDEFDAEYVKRRKNLGLI